MTVGQIIITIRRIEEIIGGPLQRLSEMRSPANKVPEGELTAVLHEISRNWRLLDAVPHGLAVAEAFHCEQLFDPDFPVSLSAHGPDGRIDREIFWPVYRGFMDMIAAARALDRLAVPKELGEPGASVLSIEIRHPAEDRLELDSLSVVIKAINSLYEALSTLEGNPEPAPLQLVKIESGSLLRIDCRGLDKVVAAVTQFLMECWVKWRYRRPDEVLHRNDAVFSSLAVMATISAHEASGHLTPEQSRRLRHQVFEGATALFSNGAILASIPEHESVSNRDLLASFNPKLLGEPNPGSADAGGEGARPGRKKAVRKAAKKPRRS